jgi:hypothetical protein
MVEGEAANAGAPADAGDQAADSSNVIDNPYQAQLDERIEQLNEDARKRVLAELDKENARPDSPRVDQERAITDDQSGRIEVKRQDDVQRRVQIRIVGKIGKRGSIDCGQDEVFDISGPKAAFKFSFQREQTLCGIDIPTHSCLL